ncbi:Gfo/Idh/MocA family protein [Kerstersia similis]|uniref:Gfo/Idh/MocA family protein n=1 Tax=Kerstersia similis TaxID=206505 RepID=UPI0039F06E01
MAKKDLAVIGAGAIGRIHIEAALRSAQWRLSAVVDPSEAGRALAGKVNAAWYADIDAMYASQRPDGVIVATPNHTHVSLGISCLERGSAVLVEKPIADSVAEARQLCDAAQGLGLPLLVGHQRRHNVILRQARDIVASGRLGRIVAANGLAAFMKPDSYFEAAWRREPGGGPILINMIHDIDLLRFLLGEVSSVQAVSANQVRGHAVEDTAAVVLTFASGALATLMVSDAAASPWCWDMAAGEAEHYPRQNVNSHYLVGTQASLTLPLLELWEYRGQPGWHEPLTMTRTAPHLGHPYDEQLRHFAAVIDAQEIPVCSGEDGLRTLQVTLAVGRAASSGDRVELE